MLTEKRFGFKKLCVMFLAFAILAQVFLPNSLLNPLTVSAASGDNWDLSNFVTNVTLDGNPISGTYSVGESYVFKISFAERAGANGQFAYKNGVLTYQLPEGLKTTPVTGGSIRSSSGATIGTYDIDSSGLVKVKFNDCKVNGTPTAGVNFIDNYTDASFSLEIKAQFDKVPSGGKVIFDLNSSVTLNLAGPQPALTVEKKAGSVTSAKTISYTVTVKASGAPVTNITLKDIPFARIGTNSAGTQYKITDAALFAAYSNIKFSKNSESPTAIADFASLTGSGYTFTGVTLNPGDTLTLTYTLDVQKLVTLANSKGVKLLNSSSYAVSNPLHYDLYVGNDLEVTSPSTDPKVYKASVQSRVTRAFISKIHTGTPSASNPNINWEATVGDGTMPLNGDAIIDTLGAYMAFPADTAIKVTFYNASSAKIGSKDFTMAELTALNASYVTISGSKLTINVPPATAEYSSGNKFGDVYKVVLKYTTPATLPSAGNSRSYQNKIEYGTISDSDTVSISVAAPVVTPEPAASVKKTSVLSQSFGEYEVNYNIEVTIPAGLSTPNKKFSLHDSMYLNGVGSNIGIKDDENFDGFHIDIIGMESGEPAFAYNRVFNATKNEFDIYFGSTTADNDTSMWQYDTAKTLIISYSVPLSQEISNGKTILDYLKEDKRYRLRNDVSLRKGAGSAFSSSYAIDAWPVHKEGRELFSEHTGDGLEIFDFTVFLNYNQTADRFSQSAVFKDEFDSRLSYVPGSFYVIVKSSSSSSGTRYNATTASIKETAGKLEVDFSKFVTGWSGNPIFEVHYQLALKPEASISDGATLRNTAIIEAQGSNGDKFVFTNDTTLVFDSHNIRKDMLTNGSNLAEVEIIINPHGYPLLSTLPEAISSGDTSIKVTDTMSSNLTYYANTIKFYEETSSGVWTEKAVQSTGNWSFSAASDTMINFQFPDSTPIKIVYTALIKADAGKQTEFWNKVDLYGEADSYETKTYKIQTVDAQATGFRSSVTVFKQDEDDSEKTLSGAKFDLYMYIPGGDSYDGKETNKISINSYDFYRVLANVTTDEDGEALFDSEWLTPSHKAIYLAVETAQPTGYLKPSSKDAQSFFVLNPGLNTEELSDELDRTVELIADHIIVTNKKDPTVPPTPTTTTTKNNNYVPTGTYPPATTTTVHEGPGNVPTNTNTNTNTPPTPGSTTPPAGTTTPPSPGVSPNTPPPATPPTTPPPPASSGPVSLRISKHLEDSAGNNIGDGKHFAVRIYDASMTMIHRVDLTANGESVVIPGLESGTTYYIQEEESSEFTTLGFEIEGVTEINNSAAVGIHIPDYDYDIEIGIIVKNLTDDPMNIPDEPIPLGVYKFPENPPVIEIPEDLPPLGGFQFPDGFPENPGPNPYTSTNAAIPLVMTLVASGIIVLCCRKKQ